MNNFDLILQTTNLCMVKTNILNANNILVQKYGYNTSNLNLRKTFCK